MPYKDFSTEDVLSICCDIARRDDIRVKIPLAPKGIFRRSSSIDQPRRESLLARKLSIQNGILTADGNSSESYKQLTKLQRKFSVDSRLNSIKKNEQIPGLKGREVVAMAILLDKHGAPIKTYTEKQNIPSEEVDSADKIIITRVPVPKSNLNTDQKQSKDSNDTPLVDILEGMDIKQSRKLFRRLEKILDRLHTTDLNTALSFLKVERYSDVRKELKIEMLEFASKELKVII